MIIDVLELTADGIQAVVQRHVSDNYIDTVYNEGPDSYSIWDEISQAFGEGVNSYEF